MLSDKFISIQKKLLQDLGDRLDYEAGFSKQFIDASSRPSIEKEWMSNVRNLCIYNTFLIKNTISSLENYRHLSKEQLGYYIGKIAIQHLLEIINSFEQIINKLVIENGDFRLILEQRIKQKNDILEESWKKDGSRKSKKLKKSLKRVLMRKINEMAFIRDTLLSEKIINELDSKILKFAWDIRNSMHNNFSAIKDIDFTYPDIKTGKTYSFSFLEGEELYHPEDLVSYSIVTEQIIFILLGILQKFPISKNSS